MLRAEIQVVTVRVSDDDRAKDFSAGELGWHVDHDQVVSADLRFVQLTPPGSACSIAFGRGCRGPCPARCRP